MGRDRSAVRGQRARAEPVEAIAAGVRETQKMLYTPPKFFAEQSGKDERGLRLTLGLFRDIASMGSN